MKKYSKCDYFNIIIIVASFFVIFVFLLIHNGSSYASKIDYSYQHYMIPEYFRTLFYNTKKFIPSFAFNLGMGQNIFNFSYYGFLSPIIILSYLFPFLSMKAYLEGVSVILFLISILLCYVWISNETNNRKLRFICTFLFTMSGPLILHTHRHIMFMCYMPFIFMGLFGVKNYFYKKSPWLLILSNVLIITSSYFFSIPALICLFVYYIYLYLEKNKNINIRDFVKDHIVFAWYFIVPVLISAVLLLPSFRAILDNRFKDATEESILMYLIPHISFRNILYSSYSMGLSVIFIISIIYLILKNNKSTRFLAIIFACFLCFPIFNYVLNGFMYINGKVFIPFIPLGILLIKITLEDLLFKKVKLSKMLIIIALLVSILGCINYNSYIQYTIDLLLVAIALFLARRKNLVNIFIVLLASFSFANCLFINATDKFSDSFIEKNQYDSNIESFVNYTNDASIYRTADLTNKAFNANNIRDISEYKTTMYSSITNKYYKGFYWYIFNTNNPNRNDGILSDVSNPLFNIYFANKYLISDGDAPIGYKLIDGKNNYKLYKNDDAFSIGYRNSKLMSEKEFDSLKYPYNIEALLNYTIVNKDIDSGFNSRLEKVNISDISNELKTDYKFNLKDDKNINLKINQSFDNKIFIIKFDMNYSQGCKFGDTSITINGVMNTLTCKSWKYHNHNYDFTYVLSNPKEFNIDIVKGKYEISNIELYTLDYNYVKSINDLHDEFIIDRNATFGDVIKGHINVRENGYFNFSIPYDKGYNIFVDGKKVNYQMVNKAFIGFDISSGSHDVTIKYTAPWLNLGKVLSIIGLGLLVITIVVSKGVMKHEKDINGGTLL